MTCKVRFAPSPTGLLHVGNARTALINALFARRHGGRMLLRIDDTDRERSRVEFVEATARDLRWLGISWDEQAHQSHRIKVYRDICDVLRISGRLYPCYETPDELEYKRKRAQARGRPPVYDRSALQLTDDDRRELEASGRRAHWRFLLESGPVAWNDLVRGHVELQADTMSDPVVVRADGTFLYMLPSVIDDIDFYVSHVIRGEDHVANTAVQIQMFQALGAEPPTFAHLPLLTDLAGKGLSKRLGSLTVQSLRSDGIEAMALNGFLAQLGTGEGPEVRSSVDDLARDFDIGRFGRATPKFDEPQLRRFNEQVIRELPFTAVAARLADAGYAHADAAFWDVVRHNLSALADVGRWHQVCFGEIVPVVRNETVLRAALEMLPAEPWDDSTWEAWTGAVRAETGKSGRELFQPLRLALTAADRGPEMRGLLPFIGRERAEQRLRTAILTAATLKAAEATS